MSTLAIMAIEDAALLIGDPDKQTVSESAWLPLLNMAERELSRRLRIIKRIATFKIAANLEVYTLPDDCVQMTKLEYSPTPTLRSSWRPLREMSEPVYRALTNQTYPTGEPWRYFPEQGYFYLDTIPTTTVVGGGKITYWGLSDQIALPNTEYLGVRDALRDLVVQGMVALAKSKLLRLDEGDRAVAAWHEAIDSTRSRIQDPADDSSETIATHTSRALRMGQR